MGNYIFSQYNEVCDVNMDYDELLTQHETDIGYKNAYYWLGLRANDVEVYELMECDD